MTDAPKPTDDQIRDMLERATDGPWEAVRNTVYWEVNPANRNEGDPYTVADACASSPGDPDGLQVHNARLIAAAPDLARLALERGAERAAALARAEAAEEKARESALSALQAYGQAETAYDAQKAAEAERDRLREVIALCREETVAGFRALCPGFPESAMHLVRVIDEALKTQEGEE